MGCLKLTYYDNDFLEEESPLKVSYVNGEARNNFESDFLEVEVSSTPSGDPSSSISQASTIVLTPSAQGLGVLSELGQLGMAAYIGWSIGDAIGSNIEGFSNGVSEILITLGVPAAVLLGPGSLEFAQHGNNNGKLSAGELAGLVAAEAANTISKLGKQKLKKHRKNTRDRGSRLGKGGSKK